MDKIEQLFIDFIVAGLAHREIEHFKKCGITVEIDVKNIDYDYIKREANKLGEESEESEAKDNIVSEDLKEFFNSKYKNENN